MNVSDLPPIADTERLGRALTQRKHIAALTGTVRPAAFRPRKGTVDISAHRLTHVPSVQRKVELAEAVARERREDREPKFYGWAELSVSAAREDGRQVRATPLPENIYHADILLPQECADDPDLRYEHLNLLAGHSVLVRPPK